MSVQLGKIVALIISEHFGPVVEKVATYLFKHGSSPLLYIQKSTNLPLSKLKEALCILVKYRLVTFKPNKNENIANYALNVEIVLLILRYSKYLNIIKKNFGDIHETIVEELLQRSYLSAQELIFNVAERLRKSQDVDREISDIRDYLFQLITAKYIQRMPEPNVGERPVPIFNDDVNSDLPTISIQKINQVLSGKEQPNILVESIYWTINFDRFHQDMRDELVFQSFANKFDEDAGELMRRLLLRMYDFTNPWAPVSNPISVFDIKESIKKQAKHPNLMNYFDDYVKIMEQESDQLVRKAGDARGGSLQIYLKDIFTKFCWETVEQVVLEKFDSKAARIFRLVKLKKYVEPDKIQQLAMIPAKDAKRLSYLLLEEHFFHLQELKKPVSSNGPNKSFMLFHIELESIARAVLELCYKTIYNAMTRRSYEKKVNKRIIDKKLKVDTIILGMRNQGAPEDQLNDIDEMITPPEREILEKIDATLNKLSLVELEIDNTIFILKTFLKYHMMK